jgi:hypothetical protein
MEREKGMRKLLIAGLVVGQVIAAAQPVMAAELPQDRVSAPNQVSAFAGARLRVPLGGGREKPRAGLALTSTLRSGSTGELRFARGAELGFSGGESAIRFTLGGTPASRLAQGSWGPDGRKLGVSTIGWVAIGVGALAVAYFALFSLCRDGEICGDDGDG